jgi:tRNA threonylcarbamoyladenosine biosynthesis protein TsaE
MEIIINSLRETDIFARQLASLLECGDVVELHGDLGAGKTTLAQYIIKNLAGADVEVTSPTFNIAQLYYTPKFTIWHFDLYRLKSPKELIEIGIDEALDRGVSLIEWPEIAKEFLPGEKLVIKLSCGKNDERVVRLEGYGKWAELIRKIKNG